MLRIRFRALAAALLAVAPLVAAPPHASAQDAVVRRTVTLRARPASRGRRITTLTRGTQVMVTDADTVNGYLHVEVSTDDTRGWALASGLRFVADDGNANPPDDNPPANNPPANNPPPNNPPVTNPAGEMGGVPGTFNNCPVQGDAKQLLAQQLNPEKNRWTVPADSDVDTTVTLAAMLRPGNDSTRWNVNRAAVLTGYVVSVHPGGIETVNCHAKDVASRDTHINIALSPADATNETRQVIVEVTPRWRPNHPDWTTPALEQSILHHWVTFRGWLFYDAEHSVQSENTAPGNSTDWRATAWELHPVTSITILPGPPVLGAPATPPR